MSSLRPCLEQHGHCKNDMIHHELMIGTAAEKMDDGDLRSWQCYLLTDEHVVGDMMHRAGAIR
jgi:hypothetical protein